MNQVIRALFALAAGLVFAGCGAWPDGGFDPEPQQVAPLESIPKPPCETCRGDAKDGSIWIEGDPRLLGYSGDLPGAVEKANNAVGAIGIGWSLIPSTSGCTNGVACQAKDPVMDRWGDVLNGDSIDLAVGYCGQLTNKYNPCIVPNTISRVRTWRLDGASCGEDNDGALVRQAAVNAIDRWNQELRQAGSNWKLVQAGSSELENFTLYCTDVGMGDRPGQPLGYAFPYATRSSDLPVVYSIGTGFSRCPSDPDVHHGYQYDTSRWYKYSMSAIALSRTFLIRYLSNNCLGSDRDGFILNGAQTIWMHEIGHALGFVHFGLDNGANIMKPGFNCDYVFDNRQNIDLSLLDALTAFNSANTGPRVLDTEGQECLNPGADDIVDGNN